MGSGSLAAMAVFESRYTEDMEEDKAMELVRDSVRAGIFNDLGSGSNVDITVIRRDGTLGRHRGYQNAAGNAIDYKSKYPRPTKLVPPPGATFVIEETFKPHKKKTVAATAAVDAVVETAEMEI
jgi:20S proteasome subunit beta 2